MNKIAGIAGAAFRLPSGSLSAFALWLALSIPNLPADDLAWAVANAQASDPDNFERTMKVLDQLI